MSYIRTADETIHELHGIRNTHPEMSIPDGADLSALGYLPVAFTAPPAALLYHHVVPGPAVLEAGAWRQSWLQVPFSQEEIIGVLDRALTDHLNAAARSKRYDSIHSAALRAGYAGPFQAEGLAFASWMDDCNATGYAIMAAVQSGQRAVPTEAELIAEMPALVLP